ncbi:MAG: lysophospholipid acyltransferase family protein [Planctomycetes bacterium]|nr:lysophospholipid acyltransferase family protein [Planctomycetota bacterium]
MSVARGNPQLIAWEQFLRWRKFGERAPSEFSLRQRLTNAAGAMGARVFFRMLSDTCDIHIEGDEPWRRPVQNAGGNVIWLLWHNRIACFTALVDILGRRNHAIRVASIVSASKDGELLARPIRECGGTEIRGSSSSNATEALREAVNAARAGYSIGTVGDGPRGPRYVLKPGPVLLAKATGVPIVLGTWAGTRVVQFHRAWDQMMLPLPFSRVHFKFEAPIHVHPDASADDIAATRRDLEARLMRLTEWADANTGVAWQIPRPRPGEILKRRKAGAIADKRR